MYVLEMINLASTDISKKNENEYERFYIFQWKLFYFLLSKVKKKIILAKVRIIQYIENHIH